MAFVFIGSAIVTAASMRAAQGRMWLPLAAFVGLTAVVAGLEAWSIRRGHARAPVGAWLPAALGMAAAARHLSSEGPRGPDAGVADSIVLAAVVVGAIALAVVVNLVAAIAARRRGAERP